MQRECHVKTEAEIRVMTNQGMPRIASCHQKLGDRHKTFSLIALRRNQACWHIDLRLLASTTETIGICCFQASRSWYFIRAALTDQCVSPHLDAVAQDLLLFSGQPFLIFSIGSLPVSGLSKLELLQGQPQVLSFHTTYSPLHSVICFSSNSIYSLMVPTFLSPGYVLFLQTHMFN